mmetsp:Transcript_8007/g.18564  ORF Transcript_8007/g.18564 Transcript_8007/m.18564 type:complete len:232 (-) Transcript_8007:208-903(-)
MTNQLGVYSRVQERVQHPGQPHPHPFPAIGRPFHCPSVHQCTREHWHSVPFPCHSRYLPRQCTGVAPPPDDGTMCAREPHSVSALTLGRRTHCTAPHRPHPRGQVPLGSESCRPTCTPTRAVRGRHDMLPSWRAIPRPSTRVDPRRECPSFPSLHARQPQGQDPGLPFAKWFGSSRLDPAMSPLPTVPKAAALASGDPIPNGRGIPSSDPPGCQGPSIPPRAVASCKWPIV